MNMFIFLEGFLSTDSRSPVMVTGTNIRRHEKWLKTWLCIRNGIASASTVSRRLTGMDEEMFILAFTGWVGDILRSRGLHIAIDGKAIRAGMSKVTGSKIAHDPECSRCCNRDRPYTAADKRQGV